MTLPAGEVQISHDWVQGKGCQNASAGAQLGDSDNQLAGDNGSPEPPGAPTTDPSSPEETGALDAPSDSQDAPTSPSAPESVVAVYVPGTNSHQELPINNSAAPAG